MNIEQAEAFELILRRMDERASPWHTTKQAAAYCQTSETTIGTLTRKGQLKVKFLAGHARYHRDDLDKVMTDRKQPLITTGEVKLRSRNGTLPLPLEVDVATP